MGLGPRGDTSDSLDSARWVKVGMHLGRGRRVRPQTPGFHHPSSLLEQDQSVCNVPTSPVFGSLAWSFLTFLVEL